MKGIIFLSVLFLLINFGGLAIGNWLMVDGPNASWYLSLKKAPWTPPGWVFGTAWTIIMICFSIYLAYLFKLQYSKIILFLFIIEFVLNVSWNYIFFNQHWVLFALIVLVLLTSLIFYFFFTFKTNEMLQLRWLLMPYMVWLCIAVSLNLYVLVHN
jgi:tryptophan-rich sensory protein